MNGPKEAADFANKVLAALRAQGLDCVSGGSYDVSQNIHTAILHAARSEQGNAAAMTEVRAYELLAKHVPPGATPYHIPDWKPWGEFDAEELEALAWWLRNGNPPK